MFSFKSSHLVMAIILFNLIFSSLSAVISKTSPLQPYVSPSRKLNAYSNGVSARSNVNLQNVSNQSTRLSSANLTNETPINSSNDNVRINEDNLSAIEPISSNFTTDDVQVTMTNDKSIESNVSNTDAKPFEEDLNKVAVNNPTQYFSSNDAYNSMVSQVNTFNDNLEYAANNDAFKCVQCATTSGLELNSHQLERCCSAGFRGCCSESIRNLNSNYQQNSPPLAVLNEQSNSPPSTNLSNNNPSAQVVTNKNVEPMPTPMQYGTKTKNRSPAAKIRNPVEPAEENIDVRQRVQQPSINSNIPIPGYTNLPNLLNGLYLNKDNKIYYTNSLDKLNPELLASMQPFQYSNQYTNLNPINNLNSYGGLNNLYSGQFEHFGRKTSNPNRYGTKTGSSANLISDSSINQPIIEQQFQSKQQSNENLQPITNPISMNSHSSNVVNNLPVSTTNNNPINNLPNQVNTPQQQNSNINSQRVNTRNPNEIIQQQPQQPTQQQGGITNAFSSFVSHIPFIGFNPIPVVFGGYGSSAQQQQQMNNQQIAQIVTTSDNQINGQAIQSNYPYNTVIAIRPQSQNAQLINPTQLHTKVVNQANPQSTNTNQIAQNPGFVSTIFSRPYNLYQRLGGYFRPNKPILHYANSQYIPIDYLNLPPELLNESNLQNLFQQYSHPITTSTNQNTFDTVGQWNPNVYYQLLSQAAAAKSSKRS